MSTMEAQLRAYLEDKLIQGTGLLQRNHATSGTPTAPNQNRLNEVIPNGINSSSKSDFKQSLTSGLEEKEILLINLLREFTKKDEGKVLVAEFGKFARFLQSEVAKASKEEEVSM